VTEGASGVKDEERKAAVSGNQTKRHSSGTVLFIGHEFFGPPRRSSQNDPAL
jgi:hypothetical protein